MGVQVHVCSSSLACEACDAIMRGVRYKGRGGGCDVIRGVCRGHVHVHVHVHVCVPHSVIR